MHEAVGIRFAREDQAGGVAARSLVGISRMELPLAEERGPSSRMFVAGVTDVDSFLLHAMAALCSGRTRIDRVSIVDASTDREALDNLNAHCNRRFAC